MATQFSWFLHNENVKMNAGKTKTIMREENADFVKGSKNVVNKSRKPLGDISNYQKTKLPLLKEKPAKLSVTKTKSVPKNKNQLGSSDVKSRKCENWADEEIEHMSFPWVEQMERERELFEKRIDAGVDDIMAGFRKRCNEDILMDFMIVCGEFKSEVDDPYGSKELPLKLDEEILLPQVRTADDKNYEPEPELYFDESLTLNVDPGCLRLKEGADI